MERGLDVGRHRRGCSLDCRLAGAVGDRPKQAAGVVLLAEEVAIDRAGPARRWL
jgi:hypothetical protein